MPDPIPPWGSDCDLDEKIAREAIVAALPGFEVRTLQYLHEGWDNRVFEVNGEWIFRMPKRANVAVTQETEQRLLALLAPRLPVAVPEFELFGEPSRHYPHPFRGYRKLPGVLGHLADPRAVASLEAARALGRAVAALHTVPPAQAHDAGVPDEDPGRDPEAYLADWLAKGARVFEAFEGDRAARARRHLEEPTPPTKRAHRLCHADLDLGHLLFDESTGALVGMIDWTDAVIGDPLGDFVAFQIRCGRSWVKAALCEYGAEPLGDWQPAIEARARHVYLLWIAETLARDPEALEDLLPCFENVFPEP